MVLFKATAYTLSLIAFGADAASAIADGWRADLPWSDLQSKLSSSATLIDTGYNDFSSQCFPEFINFEYNSGNAERRRSAFGLIDQPSGLCLPHLSCSYDKCNPRSSVNGQANLTYDQHSQDINAMSFSDILGTPLPASFDPADPGSYFNDPSNPSLDIPTKVLHPIIASDVVAAVQFAKEHGLELSVKNSGHSWQGASSKKDTLHINMNRYTQYAPTGITDCDAESLGSTISADLSDQPCHLSIAKNKPAVIRVGGGENWDKTYRAVFGADDVGGGKYHIVGGSASTVSPMGWTFQGGLSGDTGGSKYGLGADQVIQIEMVLPNGFHVKFGPTEWEDASAEGFIVPRTVSVTGLCRSNPDEQDEENWIWGECPDDFDVDFMDLWYAVRGGGGGTWGIILSIHLQLHDFLPRINYLPSNSEECLNLVFIGDLPFSLVSYHPLWVEFLATYAMTPSVLNVTNEESRSCGCPHTVSQLFCYGEEAVSKAWITFLEMKNIAGGEDCLLKTESDMTILPSFPPGSRFEGQFQDSPSPGLAAAPVNGILIPRSWIEKVGVQEAMNIIGPIFLSNYPVFGSAAIASDQANSVSKAHRNAGIMILGIEFDETFWRDIAPQMFDLDDTTNFPPIVGSNHAATGLTGPLKADWTKPCPTEWTFEERSADCVPFQEIIYGTETLNRLEAIKEVVDPNNMFDCHNCITNNRTKEQKQEAGVEDQAIDGQDDVSQKDDVVASQDEGSGSSSPNTRYSFFSAVAMAVGLWFIK